MGNSGKRGKQWQVEMELLTMAKKMSEVTGWPPGTFDPDQKCRWCKSRVRPGRADQFLCASEGRMDLEWYYGVMRILPADGGESCEAFEFNYNGD